VPRRGQDEWADNSDTPWVDREGGYYAIIAMEVDDSQTSIVQFSVELARQL
jgi:hypothetical protein